MQLNQLSSILKKYQNQFHTVVDFNHEKENVISIDLSKNNKALFEEVITNNNKLENYIQTSLQKANASLAIGGYAEERNVYNNRSLFSAALNGGEARTLHLGIDIWCAEGTPFYAFTGGMVHSFAFNKNAGDYGATLILLHQLDGIPFYSLYGHISLNDISNIKEGDYFIRGQKIVHAGGYYENGNWPPHLHLQLIADMEFKKGDYPGVCKTSDREYYINNCPDPDLILQLMRYAVK